MVDEQVVLSDFLREDNGAGEIPGTVPEEPTLEEYPLDNSTLEEKLAQDA